MNNRFIKNTSWLLFGQIVQMIIGFFYWNINSPIFRPIRLWNH